MKKNIKVDLAGKTGAELKKMLLDAQKELRDALFDKEQFKLKNTRMVYNKRKDIAVLQTLIRMKGGETSVQAKA